MSMPTVGKEAALEVEAIDADDEPFRPGGFAFGLLRNEQCYDVTPHN